MDTLISLGTISAWLWSTVVLVGGIATETYFEVGAAVTTLILLGRYLEARAKGRSSEAIRKLVALGAKEARLLRGDEEVLVPVSELQVGDLFVVGPGEKVATDGTVVEGASAIDQSMLTGEPVPIEVAAGSEVAGATINSYGRLVVRATRVGADTALAGIARLVDAAQSGKAPVQRLADRVSSIFVPIVIAALAGDADRLARLRCEREHRVYRRRFGARDRVPLRARPRDTDRADGRHRPRGAARDPAQGPGDPRADPQGRDDRARQDGTITEGKLELVDLVPRNGADPARDPPSRRSRRSGIRAPGRAGDREAARVEVGTLPPVTAFRNLPGTGVQGVVEGHRVEVGRSDGAIAVAWDGEPRAAVTCATPSSRRAPRRSAS